LDPNLLEAMVQEVPLEGAVARAHELMAGRVRGRTVVKIGT
jgi:acrylyl-CoA reductase (NADPH)